jgi:predicted transglutaminase-like cysteine proteinase
VKLETFFKLYEYRSEKGDQWRIPKIENGQILGDCEDAALGVLYYVIANESLVKFWWLLLTSAKICYVKNDGEGHAVLKYKGQYIDNWTMKWVSKQEMEALGHKFHFVFYLTYQVAVKMLYTKVRDLIKGIL